MYIIQTCTHMLTQTLKSAACEWSFCKMLPETSLLQPAPTIRNPKEPVKDCPPAPPPYPRPHTRTWPALGRPGISLPAEATVMVCSDVVLGCCRGPAHQTLQSSPACLLASCAVVSYVTMPISADFLTCSGLSLPFAVSIFVLCLCPW